MVNSKKNSLIIYFVDAWKGFLVVVQLVSGETVLSTFVPTVLLRISNRYPDIDTG